MKKALVLSAAAAVTLSACSAADNPNPQEEQPVVGVANPASEFCVKQGGRLELKKDALGNEYALCHLPDGKVAEEWEYFRKHSK